MLKDTNVEVSAFSECFLMLLLFSKLTVVGILGELGLPVIFYPAAVNNDDHDLKSLNRTVAPPVLVLLKNSGTTTLGLTAMESPDVARPVGL